MITVEDLDRRADEQGLPRDGPWNRAPSGMYFWKDGTPMTLRQYAVAFEDFDLRVVAQTRFRDAFLSTVWVGIDYSFGRSPLPHVFESMCFVAPGARVARSVRRRWDGMEWRHAGEVQALAAHDQLVTELRRWFPTKAQRRAERRRLQRTLR